MKDESYNSGNAQFFIMTKKNAGLNGLYTPIGKVIEGMDVVHKIEGVEVKLLILKRVIVQNQRLVHQ